MDYLQRSRPKSLLPLDDGRVRAGPGRASPGAGRLAQPVGADGSFRSQPEVRPMWSRAHSPARTSERAVGTASRRRQSREAPAAASVQKVVAKSPADGYTLLLALRGA